MECVHGCSSFGYRTDQCPRMLVIISLRVKRYREPLPVGGDRVAPIGFDISFQMKDPRDIFVFRSRVWHIMRERPIDGWPVLILASVLPDRQSERGANAHTPLSQGPEEILGIFLVLVVAGCLPQFHLASLPCSPSPVRFAENRAILISSSIFSRTKFERAASSCAIMLSGVASCICFRFYGYSVSSGHLYHVAYTPCYHVRGKCAGQADRYWTEVTRFPSVVCSPTVSGRSIHTNILTPALLPEVYNMQYAHEE